MHKETFLESSDSSDVGVQNIQLNVCQHDQLGQRAGRTGKDTKYYVELCNLINSMESILC